MSERSESNVGLTDLLDGWHQVAEELPPIDVLVWLFDGREICIGERSLPADADGWLWAVVFELPWWGGQKWHCGRVDNEDIHPTHWRPLPMPPNSDCTDHSRLSSDKE